MKPSPHVQIQAVLALAAAVVTVALCGRSAAIGVTAISGVAVLVVGFVWRRYEHVIRDLRRTRSERRARLDAVMVRCFAVGLAAPLAVGLLSLFARAAFPGIDPPLDGGAAVVASIAVNVMFTSVLVSSCVDWYLVLPYRNGVVGPPTCQMAAHDDDTTLFYARAWVTHRAAAELLGWGGLATVLIIALVAAQDAATDPVLSALFTYVGPPGAIYVAVGAYLGRRLPPVREYLQEPSPGLGRWVSGTTRDGVAVEGFVVDVSVRPGLQVRSAAAPRQKVSLRDATRLRWTTRPLCGTRCEHWIPDCEIGLIEAEAAAGKSAVAH